MQHRTPLSHSVLHMGPINRRRKKSSQEMINAMYQKSSECAVRCSTFSSSFPMPMKLCGIPCIGEFSFGRFAGVTLHKGTQRYIYRTDAHCCVCYVL